MTPEFDSEFIRPLETLVVDDDYRWRYLVASNLQSLGMEPILAARGVEALEIMAERPFDLVIADLLMPGMDGSQFLTKARRLFPRTQVILLSADFDAFPVSPEKLVQQGALAAIPKTEICSTLVRMLRLLQEVTNTRMPGTDSTTGLLTAGFSLN